MLMESGGATDIGSVAASGVADLTVVIPVYNRAAVVEDTLRTVAAQSLRPRELILVDNGSSDSTYAILDRWAGAMRRKGWCVTLLSEPRKGAARARQTGLDRVSTEYVMFFDSDDWMHPDHVRRVMEDFLSAPFPDITCWSVAFHNDSGRSSHRRVHPAHPLRNHMVQGLLSTLGYAVRTSFIRRAGGWNTSLGGWDDLELGARLLLNGPVIRITPEPRAEVRVHGDSMSGDGYAHRAGDWERSLDEIERVAAASSRPERCDVLRLVAYRRAILAAHYRREGLRDESRALLLKALNCKAPLSLLQRGVIRFAYRFTAAGLPGAGAIFPQMLSR